MVHANTGHGCQGHVMTEHEFRLLYMTVTGHAMTRHKFQILSRFDDWR